MRSINLSSKKKAGGLSSAEVSQKVEERAADGTTAFKSGNYAIAISCYSEALKALATRDQILRATITRCGACTPPDTTILVSCNAVIAQLFQIIFNS